MRARKYPIEKAIVQRFMADFNAGIYPEGVTCGDGDVIVKEFHISPGRADIAILHADKRITLVEVKDGRHGLRHVVGGIGQVAMYKAALRQISDDPVWKVLLWTSIEDKHHDADSVVMDACEQSLIVPILWPRTVDLIAQSLR